ncbi:hypothetical protein [Streptomyces sp. NPDC006879]|uniref:hypothetical protein n=1 Tax=Streptomyces sp. NPDC006879 TaxID=3364767 RepID=UPI0036B068BE
MALASNSPVLPVKGLADLSNESRMIATPWSRMVRGIGLGQYPVDYDPATATRIRRAFDLLAVKVPASNSYTLFSRRLAEFVLKLVDPECEFGSAETQRDLDGVLAAVRSEGNPYWRLMAGCILMDAFAKLRLDRTLLVNERLDFPAEVLALVDRIEPDQIKDENAGRHGDYEKLSAFSAVFLALGQLGLKERLVTSDRHYVKESLNLLERVPAPFFRGRGGSMLFSVISLLGHDALIFDGERNYMREVLDHLDRADDLGSPPAFPQPMSAEFSKIYPLVTMLNAVAMSGRSEYLTYGRDRLAQMKELWAGISPVERTHMGLYYLVALHNLGRLEDQLPDKDAFVEGVVGMWEQVDPGANFFLNGIAYAYMIETAMLTGRMDLITERMLDRVVDSYPDLDRTDLDRVNRPYPFAYLVNMLGEIGQAQRLFSGRERYAGESAFAWVVDHLSPAATEEGSRLYMLDHALISQALRMRGAERAQTSLFEDFRFRSAAPAEISAALPR